MLHRGTLFAIPIVGVVLAGSGLGWWGYNQYQQKQSFALQYDNQVNQSFHSFVGHIGDIHTEIGKTLLTKDTLTFQTHLRELWRLSYTAQAEAARLPFALMPLHRESQYLAALSQTVNGWMDDNASATNPQVHQKLETFYNQSQQMSSSLQSMQAKSITTPISWTQVNHDLQTSNEDNQVIDGFRKMDDRTGAFVESSDQPSVPHKGASTTRNQSSANPIITQAMAEQFARRFLGLPIGTTWKTTLVKGPEGSGYRLEGTVKGHDTSITVDGATGQIRSFNMNWDSPAPTDTQVDLPSAENTANNWLRSKGYSSLGLLSSNQLDGSAFFVYAPVRPDGSWVLGQTLSVKVAEREHQITGMDASKFIDNPVGTVPPRRLNESQLQQKLSSDFSVEMTRKALVLDSHNHYQPCIAFYGTSHDETYCVYMNANTGHEILTEKLT